MAINKSVSIEESVGKGGVNKNSDVTIIQSQLNAQMPTTLSKLVVSGNCDQTTIDTILEFQRVVLGFRHPDGRVDPSGKTIRALNDPTSESKWASGPDAETSSGEWTGDSARWPEEKKLRSLDPEFRVKVENVLSALKLRDFQPKVFYGWRSVAVQQELFEQGNSTIRFSFHNAQKPDGTPNAYAADIIDRRWAWEEPAETNGFWKALGEEAKKNGLVWGGDWQGFKDSAHIQGRQNHELAQVKRESGL